MSNTKPSRLPAPFPADLSLLSASALKKHLLSRYRLPAPLSCTYFARGLNDTYQVKAGRRLYYLRAYRFGRQSLKSVQAELEVLDFLQSGGFYAAAAVKDRSGDAVHLIQAPEGERPAVLFEGARGEFVPAPEFEQCQSLGALLAEIHQLSDENKTSFARPPIDARALVERPLKLIKPLLSQRRSDFARLSAIGRRLKYLISGLRRRPPEYGFCHGDLHVRNVRFKHDSIVMFDLDCCGDGWRAFDIASFLWSRYVIERDLPAAAEARFKAFLKGYTSRRELGTEEIGAIPVFTALRELWGIGLQAACRRDWGAEVFHGGYWEKRLGFIYRWCEDYALLKQPGSP